MVTTVEKQVETRQPTLEEIGESLGIPIKVRPWWGSMRDRSRLMHSLKSRNRIGGICGGTIIYTTLGISNIRKPFCLWCNNFVRPEEVKRVPATRKWECPAGPNYSQLKRPEVQGGTLIIWEGQCKYRGHTHRQLVKVIDTDADSRAMIISVASSTVPSHLLIGMDSGHPFVTPILRKLKTVQDAFDWLVPNKVREALTLGIDVKRQGDWFFLPWGKEPRLNNGISTNDWVWGSRPRLLMHTLYHRVHLIYGAQTRHIGETVVYKHVLGLPYPAPIVTGDVQVPDHPTLRLVGWHVGIRTRSTPGGNRDAPGMD